MVNTVTLPEFANPWGLLLLPAAPLAAWRWLRRRRPALRFPGAHALAELPPGRARRARFAGALLRGLGLLALVLALAGPRWPDPGTRLPAEGVAIEFVLDVSGSMAEPDFDWHGQPLRRLDAVKRAFRLFVEGGDAEGVHFDGRPSDRIGLIAFARFPETVAPLTLSHVALLTLFDAEEPRTVPEEADTNVGDALAWGVEKLRAAGNGRKVLVLLSDGEHNVPPPALKPRQAAQLAANLGVPVYTIDAGGPLPEWPTSDDAARARLQGRQALAAVAALTGGQSFAAHDAAALLRVCAAIDRLERQPVESFQYRRYGEAYPWCGAAALACLVMALALEMTVWLRGP
jgi:Ca-activated chloride channel family protein